VLILLLFLVAAQSESSNGRVFLRFASHLRKLFCYFMLVMAVIG